LSWLSKVIGGDSETRVRVLAILPNPADRSCLAEIAAREKWNLRMASDCESALEILKHNPPEVIVCARDVKPSGWREAMGALGTQAPGISIILATPANDDRLWLEVIERGGFDVITTPLHENRVVETVRLAWRQSGRRG